MTNPGRRTLKGRQISTQRERNILLAARQIVIGEGLVGLRMPELAHSADVSMGTLYRHFQSRDDVIAALSVQALMMRHTKLAMVLELFSMPQERLIAAPLLDFLINVAHPEAFHTEVACSSPCIWNDVSATRQRDFETITENLTALMEHVGVGIASSNQQKGAAAHSQIAVGIWGMVTGLSFVWHSQPESKDHSLKDALSFFRPHLISFLRGYGPDVPTPFGTINQLETYLLENKGQWQWALKGDATDESH